jgi:hypothetical protein
VKFPRNNVEKCGNVIALADLRDDAAAAAEKAVSLIIVRLEADCAATDEFLEEDSDRNEKGFPPSAYIVLADTAEISGVIPEHVRVSDVVPHELQQLFSSDIEDWNHRTLRMTCAQFDAVCPDHPVLDAGTFWRAVVRGGIQGALYVSDSTAEVRSCR